MWGYLVATDDAIVVFSRWWDPVHKDAAIARFQGHFLGRGAGHWGWERGDRNEGAPGRRVGWGHGAEATLMRISAPLA